MLRRSWKSSSSPQITGVQWSSTVESTLWGMTPGMAVVLGGVLGIVEIALASSGFGKHLGGILGVAEIALAS